MLVYTKNAIAALLEALPSSKTAGQTFRVEATHSLPVLQPDDWTFVTIRRVDNNYCETIRISSWTGGLVTIAERAVGTNDIPLDFAVGDPVAVTVSEPLLKGLPAVQWLTFVPTNKSTIVIPSRAAHICAYINAAGALNALTIRLPDEGPHSQGQEFESFMGMQVQIITKNLIRNITYQKTFNDTQIVGAKRSLLANNAMTLQLWKDKPFEKQEPTIRKWIRVI